MLAKAMNVARRLPPSWKHGLRKLTPWLHPLHPSIRGLCTVQDLYYWTSEHGTQTIIPCTNYFSEYFPELDTATFGQLHIFNASGQFIQTRHFHIPARGCTPFAIPCIKFGTCFLELTVPQSVRAALVSKLPFAFWDRFSISYQSAKGNVSFVHGVDKTLICRDDWKQPKFWYPAGQRYSWNIEAPINLADYKQLSVVVINRTEKQCRVHLTATSTIDQNWYKSVADIPSLGVHRFQLNAHTVHAVTQCRLRLDGMPTPYGRPVLFAEFPDGTIDVMHT